MRSAQGSCGESVNIICYEGLTEIGGEIIEEKGECGF